ncbi:type II toxin-antitoxin system HipA family toxin [Sulfurimonas sp. SAG-AH-194-C20]|nr:type II toxin-antitoxin system HipA family toxin [Sulfurimonas sp. SAG-AH-194-C20]MDF1879133.1 type II toxin-antitoxin system HipA family toxin [Sulfurimonas sp. SAG-AH-194-C20]
MLSSLVVKVDNGVVGELTQENNQYIFSYDKDNTKFISLTMQPRIEQYFNDRLHPIFEMHLPEGYLLAIIKKYFSKITKTDDFGLLKLMSGNINGRVTYETKRQSTKKVLSLDELINPASSDLFEELVSKYALSSALSGVQPKVLATIENKATLQLEDYIVKSWGEEYPELAINEYYSMLVVKYAGVEVPEFYLSSDDKLFIMKRFDIQDDGVKLGFEDMCVLQAKHRDDKYEGSYEQVVKTIKTFVSPKHKRESLKQFFKMMVINNLLQNGDAHLKNYGLLYSDIQNIKLAPAYDVVSTTAYIKNDIPALHLLGSKKWWEKKYLLRFGIESCDLSKSEVLKLYEECVVAARKVGLMLDERISSETNESKLVVLEHLKRLLGI